MGPSSEVQIPDFRPHRLQRRSADPRQKTAEHRGVLRVLCPSRPEAVAKEVKLDVRIAPLPPAVLTVDNPGFGGVHLKPAFRQASSPSVDRLGPPKSPANPFRAGGSISWLQWFAHCY